MADDTQDARPVPAPPPDSSPAKQPYVPPQLVDYGTVSELTQGATGTRTDGHPVKKFIQP